MNNAIDRPETAPERNTIYSVLDFETIGPAAERTRVVEIGITQITADGRLIGT